MFRFVLLALVIVASLFGVSMLDTASAETLPLPGEFIVVPSDLPPDLPPEGTPPDPGDMVRFCDPITGQCRLVPRGSIEASRSPTSASSCSDCGPARRFASGLRERQPVRKLLRHVFRRR
ncbi:MAG TPA: hypothetical protein DCQ98_06045 [Planctomycetaceae bacterium]|nr:hypothetical protein [Planctomycetaceae bacterium]HRF01688.1 hypothetical protein [Pirellulaceae bacterium]